MAWQAVIEAEDERTELLELTGRGCLVRIVVRDAQGRWTPSTMTWCPGLGASDFGGLGAVSAPSAAPEPAAAPAPAQSPPAPAAEPAAAPAPAPEAPAPPTEEASPDPADPAPVAQPAPTAPDAVELIKGFIRVQAAVVKVFRSQIRKASGELGYLEDAPRVSSFSVPEHGSWVSRIDDTTVLLTSGKKVIELTLPKHLRDDGVDPNGLNRWLRSNKVSAVAYKGATYDVEPATLDKLIKQLCMDGVLRLFRSHPPVYIVAA